MSFINRIKSRLVGSPSIAPFASDEPGPLTCELERLFYGHQGRLIHKWKHYLPLYDRHFAPYRNTSLKMLEIGVSMGGSLEMWRSYFGANATIFGIDVESKCSDRVDPPNQVRIGSQADTGFLADVVAELGAPDIILDDGSHIASDQMASFRFLFPTLNDGGIYVIEDTHTSYWPHFEGGHGRRGTAVELAKRIMDDLHGWYHNHPSPFKEQVTGLHVYDSLIVIEKGEKSRPQHIQVSGVDHQAAV